MADDKRERNPTQNSEEEEEDIDAKLEERASHTNLSVANVKSLLHHVLKDKRVVAMARKLANEDSSSEDIDLDIPPYEPRLTRARVREAVISSVTDVNFSPDKLSSLSVSTPLLPSISISSVAAPNALDELFPDVSSTEEDDDEYLPDADTTVNIEDMLAESDTETGDPIDTEIEEEEEEREEEEEEEGEGERIQESQVTSSRGALTDTEEAVQAATLLASLSDVNFTPLKDHTSLHPPVHSSVTTQPHGVNHSEPLELSNDEIIAQRTRSKRPLVDTDINEIEASFNPPDVPSDDDSRTVQDIDEDELEWQKWLADLMNPRSADMSGLDDPEDDTEYNFWAEKHDDLEKEEFRTDRGVKIPQKEVDELIEELLNPNIGVFNADPNPIVSSLNYLDNTRASSATNSGVDLTSAYLLESLGLRPPMLCQSALQAAPLKDVNENGREAEQVMQTEPTQSSLEGNKDQGMSRDQVIQVWDQIQQHFQLLMQTFIMSRFEPSLVFISQLAAQAVNEIGGWCKEASEGNHSPLWYIPGIDEALQLITRYNPHDNNDVELISAFGNPPKVPDVVQDVIMTHGIFWQYPYHLPEHGLSPVESSGTQGSKYFTTTEDYLLVLGMDHYGSSSWKLIQEKLLPTKTTKQLHLRVKNLTSKRTKQDNVIKYYKRTGEIKIPFDKDAVDPYMFTRLPQWIIKYHLKREQVEYEEREKKEKRKEELKKIANTYNLLSSSSSSSSSCPPSSTTSPSGSKRNLKDDMESVSTSKTLKKGKKRMKLSLGPICAQSDSKTGGKGDYRQLLYMAGLEGSDPAARYAFNYLTEVKAMTMSSPDNYNTFLKLLMTARKREWSPGKLYMAVKPVLQQWPYLLKLFMAFLDPKDAIQAKVIADKIDFEQVKTFSRNLQDQYGDNPFQLSDILSKLRSLETADDTGKNQIVLELNEMMLSHDELLSDLRHFVSGVLPAKRITEKSQTDFEEVNLSSSDQRQTRDDFEEVSVPHDWEGSSSQHINSSPS